MQAYETLQKARAAGRPSGKVFIQKLCSDFIELRGDRRFGDDHAIIGGVGLVDGMPLTIIAHERGDDLADKARRNFGMAHPEGYRKALRLAKQAEKFGRPVLCLVDTQGAYSGIGAEERGQAQAIAECLGEMMTLKTPVISVVVGEGGSGGALALAVADRVWMLENSIYSVISPEGCASILWKDAARVQEACECLRLTPQDLLGMGVIEEIIPEEPEGAVFDLLKARLTETFAQLAGLDVRQLCQKRYERFRKLGAYVEAP